jgi:cytochrome d ubiquinol oxidase subunit II
VAVTIAVLAGGAILFPSLALLFRLLLSGQFDHGPDAPPLRRQVLSRSATGLFGRLSVSSLLGGLGFLTFANAGWAHALGVVCLFSFMICGFLALELGGTEGEASSGS